MMMSHPSQRPRTPASEEAGGTPARGEGHRVDARSDIYSLGVVFYELLAGRRPYRYPRMPELYDEIITGEIRPPRQLDNAIPKELERICLKALAKRASDRYTTAFDLAEDLRHWQTKRRKKASGEEREQRRADPLRACPGVSPPGAPHGGGEKGKKGRGESAAAEIPTPNAAVPARRAGLIAASAPVPPSDSDAIRTPRSSFRAPIIPKGLRSFDGEDADFFLQLLPGPTDRDGLPESIRFWKSRMERTDSDTTFSVGLSYGPSGCGKSSMMKAGVLPRLAPYVHAVYLEATSDDTESRLLKALRKVCGVGVAPTNFDEAGGTPTPQELVETIAVLRRGRGLAAGEKVVIVLDQFEQWLHSHRDCADTELVRALRQCDGGRVQCVVMVRDDFWMAASRFLRELEIPLVEGENSAATDLFDPRHARRVLEMFGRAYGCVGADFERGAGFQGAIQAELRQVGNLPHDEGELTPEQERFLDQAVAGLAEDGKVVSVRLALFAEMFKSKPWTPSTLKEIGGASGVGATFLEETFSASTAPPRHRLHQQAARALLKALLPEAGADIKGHQRGADELLAASGYERRPQEFVELLRILDAELRLITPADEGKSEIGDRKSEENDESPSAPPISDLRLPTFYQLTHDYLVPSLRDWLTRKQRETRRGRAELRLAERAAAYCAKPDSRFLPSWWEWPNIRLFTTRAKWTVPERRVMRAAGMFHGLRFTALLAVVALAIFIGLEGYRRAEVRRAETLAESVFSAPADAVRYTLDNLRPMGRLAMPRLRAKFDDGSAATVQRLRAAYALADLGHALPAGDHAQPAAGNHAQPAAINTAPREFLLAAAATGLAGECRNLVEALEHVKDSALVELARRAESADDPGAKANFAIVALQLGDPKPARQALALRGDPSARTALIHGFAAWHGDAAHVAALVAASDDPAFRSGLCLALGTITPMPSEREVAVKTLLELYTGDHDGGTHAAAGWALRQWEQELPTIKPASRPPSDRRWFVNGQGMTMVEIAEGKFTMGTAGEGGDPVEKPAHEVALTRPFYLCDREVTVEQFQRFLDDADYPAAEKPNDWKWEDWMKTYSQMPDCPVNGVNWFETVLYCNWLSTREGRKPCYERTGEKEKLKNYDTTEAEYDVWHCDFAADGYRLPTEAQWEYAARARSSEGFCYGGDEDLLSKYAWFIVNGKSRTWPGGLKLPNGFGLFDMHGNAWEWCWDWQAGYSAEAVSDPSGPAAGSARVVRGGAFHDYALNCRCAFRRACLPLYRGSNNGFRVLCGR